MADSNHVIPFILKWEGGLSKNPSDYYAKYPVPDGSGYHTNKGITWYNWSKIFGSSADSIAEFYKMPQTKWAKVYHDYYWNAIKGDNIKSQRIADLMANWAWGSGPARPIKALQNILGLNPDGVIGPITINKLNASNENDVFDKLKAANINFYKNLGNNPANSSFMTGWFNRLNDFYDNFASEIKQNSGKLSTIIVILIAGYFLLKK
jgi:lysozyme family protein